MVCHSDDSSESEKKLYVKEAKVSPADRRNSDGVSTTRGIVVANTSPSRKSPSKQRRNRNDSYRLDNPKDKCSSDDEQVAKFNTTNSKVEKFSSDNESELAFQSPSPSRTRKHLFVDDEDQETISQNHDQNMRSYGANDTADNSSQEKDENPIKKRRVVVKQVPISSEDEKPISRRNPEKLISKGELSPRKNLSQFENSEKDAEGNSSDGEIIQPSQFWLHKHKEIEKDDRDEKAAMKVTKKSSPIKNLDSDESVDSEKRPPLNTKFTGKKESPQRKSPPRIRKTEIISTKYEKVDKQIEKYKIEADLEKNADDDVDNKQRVEFGGLRGSGDDNEGDEHTPRKSDESQIDGKRKLSPVKKELSPKKAQAAPKRKLSLEPKILNKNSGIAAKLNTNNTNFPQKELDGFAGLRENGEDNDSDEQASSKNKKSQKVSQRKLSPVKKEPTPKKARASPKRKLSSEPKLLNKSSGIGAKLNTNNKNSPQKKLDGIASLTENGDDNESDEQVSSKNEMSKKLSPKKLSPVKKKQSPTKAEASPKKKSSLGSKMPKNNSGTEAKLNTSKKSSPKRNLTKEWNDKSMNSKLDICDDDTPSEEEEEYIQREETETPKKYVLALEKPKTPSKNTLKPNGTQMVLVRKSNTKIKQHAESNSSDESQSSPQEASVSHSKDVNDEDLPEGNSSNAAPGLVIKEKFSVQKKRQDIKTRDTNWSDESQPSVKKKPATSPKRQSIKNSKSTESMPVASKRKSNLDDNSSNEEEPRLSNVPKSPLRRKHPDSNSSEPVSNKRAKLMPSVKIPAHTMSDSDEMDETDSLTRLNTNLNKSMALMEKKTTETVKLNKSRKSVSINTKHTLEHTPNETKIRKSILKKPEPVAATDSSESSSSSQEQSGEQNVRENFEPAIVASKIVKRPLNLHDLKLQESLACDSTKPSFALDDVSEDDEIYILEVPRTINPRELKGQIIKLGGKNKLQVGDELYETCDKDPMNISCVFRDDEENTSYKAVNLRPAGCINVRQRLSKTLSVELSRPEKKTVPFPKNLKVRHPLFGAEYEDKIVTTGKRVVSKKIILQPVKKRESIAKTKKASTVEKSPKTLKNVEKSKNKKAEDSLELIKSENNSKKKVETSRENRGTDSASSDSDSDASFFQKVKRNSAVKVENIKKSKNSLGILDIDETLSTTDRLPDLEETTVAVKRKQLATNKKFGLSLNSSVLKNNSFDANTNTSQFFSSTPIKLENEQKDIKGEILTDKVRKRKTHSDVLKGTSLQKKVKTN